MTYRWLISFRIPSLKLALIPRGCSPIPTVIANPPVIPKHYSQQPTHIKRTEMKIHKSHSSSIHHVSIPGFMISLPTNHFPCFTISQLSGLSFYRAYLPLLGRLGGEAVYTQNIHTAMSCDVLRVSLGFYGQLVAFMLRLSILSDVFEIKLRRNKISAGNEGKSAKSMASVFLTTTRGNPA